MGALSTYTTQVQRLLHDLNFQYWPQAELTDYINEARYRVAQDTKCLRQLVTGVALTAGVEQYNATVLLPTVGPYLVDVMGITLYYNTTRYKLSQRSFTRQDARYRSWSLLQQRPVTFARMSPTITWLSPNPDQAYITDWDVAVIPTALVSDATVDQIPIPFQEPVQYYAAYKAKWKEQAQGEAALFEQQYVKMLKWCYRGYMTRIIPDPYQGTT